MYTPSNPTKPGLWLQWATYSILSYLLSIGLFIAGLGRLLNHVEPIFFGAALGSVIGLLTGFAQYLILKKAVPALTGWIPANWLGWMLFWSLNMAGFLGRGYDLPTKLLEGLGHGALFGTVLGFCQWLTLRKTGKRTGYWIGLSALIWSGSALLADGCKLACRVEGPVEFLIGLPVSAVLAGIAMQRYLSKD